jgi:hypothetical protein
MLSEREIKEKGEELAKIAIKDRLGSKQLTTIYRLAKTRPMAFVQAFIQRQIGRGVIGYSSVGPWLLKLIENLGEERMLIERILMYSVMLYDYHERLPLLKLEESIEPVVREVVERYGFKGLEVKSERGTLVLAVKLESFREDPKILASEIQDRIRRKIPEAAKQSFRVWIEQA